MTFNLSRKNIARCKAHLRGEELRLRLGHATYVAEKAFFKQHMKRAW
jgi:hypothetical protein